MPPGQGGRRPGPDGRRDRQHPRRAGDRREGGQGADPRVRLARGAARARAGEVSRKSYREGLLDPRRAGADVEGAVDHPLRPAGALRSARPCATTRRTPRRCASCLHRARVLLAGRRDQGRAGGRPGARGHPRRRGRDRRGLATRRRRSPARLPSPCWAPSGRSASPPPAAPSGRGDHYADFRRAGHARRRRWPALAGWMADPDAAPRRARLQGGAAPGHGPRQASAASCRAALCDAMLVSYLLKPSVHGHTLRRAGARAAGDQAVSRQGGGWDRGGEPAAGDARLAAYAGERRRPRARGLGPVRARSSRRAPCAALDLRRDRGAAGAGAARHGGGRGSLLDCRVPRRQMSERAREPSSAQLEEEIYATRASASTSTRRSSSGRSCSRSWGCRS